MSIPNNRLVAYGQTDIGLMRDQNEDSFFIDDEHQVFAVADGLGGLPRGSLASELAIQELAAYLHTSSNKKELALEDVFARINKRVFLEGKSVSEEMGIGTTLTVVHILGEVLKIGHIGDTAVVLFREDSWNQLTRDHTMAQDMVDNLRPGEQAYIPDYFSHTLTKCIGQLASVSADIFEHPVEPNDRVLIFSDGVTKTMELDEIHHNIMAAHDPQSFVQDLIKTANDRGGPDNITAVAIFFTYAPE